MHLAFGPGQLPRFLHEPDTLGGREVAQRIEARGLARPSGVVEIGDESQPPQLGHRRRAGAEKNVRHVGRRADGRRRR